MKTFFNICELVAVIAIWAPVFWAYQNETATPTGWIVAAYAVSLLGTIGFIFKDYKEPGQMG